ncbi:MAG: hypothetical protein IT449_11735 [Phycisphaerales bacterium]|nr:hypothetical protein [Phycisphaerales bacterium]
MRALSDATSIPQEQAGAACPSSTGPTAFATGPATELVQRDRRRAIRWAANVIAPGSGLILAGRSRLGVSLALVFTLAGVTVCWGGWIVPLSIPPILRWLGLATALLAWAGAQVSLRRLHAAMSRDQA